jgi:hypothetical protein
MIFSWFGNRQLKMIEEADRRVVLAIMLHGDNAAFDLALKSVAQCAIFRGEGVSLIWRGPRLDLDQVADGHPIRFTPGPHTRMPRLRDHFPEPCFRGDRICKNLEMIGVARRSSSAGLLIRSGHTLKRERRSAIPIACACGSTKH